MYIHRTVCISPQHTYPDVDLEQVVASNENKLLVIEPKYENIPLNILRRMGKAVRLGVGAANILLKDQPMVDGIIIGTANGGMEDCIKFLNQIIDYNEGTLTPTNFVQSTTNAVAAQIALATANKGYNITHIHRGLAFENALLDAMMLVKENPDNTYLVSGLDEISGYNFNLERLSGLYKNEITSNLHLFESTTEGTIAGEGVAMFMVNDKKENAVAKVKALKFFHATDTDEVDERLKDFIKNNVASDEQIDLFLTGENGDSRTQHFYDHCETIVKDIAVARFKQLTGEYATVSAFALWLCCYMITMQRVPHTILKSSLQSKQINTILIYNNFKGVQHSFILVGR